MTAPRKVLVVKVCCIGDVVATTPMARALRRAWPAAELCYLTGTFSLEAARRVPWADRAIEFPERASAVARAAFLRGLRAERFDVAIATHKRLSAAVGVALTGCSVRVGFDWRGSRLAWTHSVPFDAGAHEVRRLLSLLGPLGVAPDGETTEMRLLPGDAEAGADALRAAGLDPDAPTAALLPGGGVNPGTVLAAKRWTAAGFRALATSLGDAGLQVVVAGGPGDEAAVAAVAGGAGPRVAACVVPPLGALAGLLARCRYAVGGDSGPTHLAAALGVPTMTLFGPTDPRSWAPLGARHEHVWEPPSCAPCFTPAERLSARFRACRTWECLQALPAERVVAAVRAHVERLGIAGAGARR